MATTPTDWHGYPAYEYETWEKPVDVSAHPPALYTTRVNWPVVLAWGTLLFGSGVLWWLAAQGVGQLTGWW
jgi:hypothetical protein